MKKSVLIYIRSDKKVEILFFNNQNGLFRITHLHEIVLPKMDLKDAVINSLNFLLKFRAEILDIYLVLSSDYFYIRSCNIPIKKDDSLKKALSLEMGSKLPVEGDKLLYDFIKLSKTNEGNIIALAAHKTLLETIEKEFSNLNINLNIITSDIDGLICFLEYQNDIDNVLLIYVHNNFANFIFKNKQGYLFKKYYIKETKRIDDILKIYLDYFCRDLIVPKNIMFISSQQLDGTGILSYCKQKYSTEEIDLKYSMDNSNVEFYQDKDKKSYPISLLFVFLNRFINKTTNFLGNNNISFKEFFLNKKYMNLVLFFIFSLSCLFFGMTYKIFLLNKYDREIIRNINLIFKRNFPGINKKFSIEQYKSMFRGKINELKSNSNSNEGLKLLDVLKDISSITSEDLNIEITEVYFNSKMIVFKGVTPSLETISKFRDSIIKNSKYKINLKQAAFNKSKNNVHFSMEILWN